MDHSSGNGAALSGYHYLHATLLEWGITRYAGVTGGGVIHFLKTLDPMTWPCAEDPAFFSIAEYPAGFIPLGYYLTGGKIAAAVATTGAASKLLSCGLSDAKLHDIPAVYIVPLSAEEGRGRAPLQDTSEYGSNIVEQFRSELPDAVFVLDDADTLQAKLLLARHQLACSRPIVLILLHSALVKPVGEIIVESVPPAPPVSSGLTRDFLDAFRRDVSGRRLVLLVGEEMARYPDARELTTRLSQRLHCAVIWTINGANAVDRNNPYGYGYISFGGNDEALSLYQSLGEDDVLLILGACPDEYTVNQLSFAAAKTYFFSSYPGSYGQIDQSFAHMAGGLYHHASGPLDRLLIDLSDEAERQPFDNLYSAAAPQTLNHRQYPAPREGYADMVKVYQRLDRWWPAGSTGFDDVCLAYKDRQYVTQRPNNRIHFHSLYRGSAMGGAFGAAVGAKLSAPDRPVFLFTGDGCFRLFSGSLGEVREAGLVIFLLNNASFSIVGQGLPVILPDVDETHYHAHLTTLDYCAIARACGWEAERLSHDLSNLDSLLERIGPCPAKSWLIDIPVDAQQVLGHNPRVRNL